MAEQQDEAKALPRSPFPHWLWFVLLGPPRRIYENPRGMVARAGISEGATVLELGCGPGFFTEHLAQAVGASGKVIAQDVQPQMLERLKARMGRFPVSINIEPVLASSSALGLPDGSVDGIFAANVFEEINKEGETEATAAELFRVLRPGGAFFFKEHRYGVPRRVIDRVFAAFRQTGFTLVSEKQTVGSYYAWFKKAT